MLDVGADGLVDLVLPFGLGADGRADVLDERGVVGAQQLDETGFFACELVVERALGGASVADDVGNGAVAVTLVVDGGREPVEQAGPERVTA